MYQVTRGMQLRERSEHHVGAAALQTHATWLCVNLYIGGVTKAALQWNTKRREDVNSQLFLSRWRKH